MSADRDELFDRIADALEIMTEAVREMIEGMRAGTGRNDDPSSSSDPFPEWHGTFWTGYEPFESTPVPVTWQRQLERAHTRAWIPRVWPLSVADTRTPAQRQIWASAAHLVEEQLSLPPMTTIASNLRGPRGHQRMAAVIEQRFHVPAGIFDVNAEPK